MSQALFDAILARLQSATSKPIGDGEPPNPPDKGPWPYAVLHPLDDEAVWDDLAQSGTNTVPVFQVTSVGKDRPGAQWMQDAVRAALQGWAPAVAGAGVVVMEGTGPVLRDDTFTPPLFTVSDRFSLWSAA